MDTTTDIHLVMGVSNVGKSSYIQSRIESGEWASLPLFMAYELTDDLNDRSLDRACVVHYNLFRPYSNSAKNLANELLDDALLKKLLTFRDRIKVHFLIAHRAEVAKRCLLRQAREPVLKETNARYPQQQIYELLCRVDWSAFYHQWFLLLKEHHICFDIINSTNVEYQTVSTEGEALELITSDRRVHYSTQEIESIVKANRFEYQRMPLPLEGVDSRSTDSPGPATRGDDRSPMLKFLDADLTGKSILDVGCAYGFFCFEAEKRNALRVVGTEMKRHRFVGSNILKEIYGRTTHFLRQDIFSRPLDESFDIVLCFNVLHHLPEPIKALRLIAALCSETLIIEFPTLSDAKFQSTLPTGQSLDPSLPLLGVSSLPQADQTFLFSNEAIRRILMDHDGLVSSIDFHPSPTSRERSVAICRK